MGKATLNINMAFGDGIVSDQNIKYWFEKLKVW